MKKPFNQSVIVPAQHHAKQSIIMVSLYEVLKGGLAIAFALVVLFWHGQLLTLVERLTQILHHLLGHLLAPQIDNLTHLASQANANWVKALWLILGYAGLRFVEAYGLYRDKTWAYWYSVVGYGIFIPIELYYLFSRPFDWVHLAVFLLNVIIVVVVYRNMRQKGLI